MESVKEGWLNDSVIRDKELPSAHPVGEKKFLDNSKIFICNIKALYLFEHNFENLNLSYANTILFYFPIISNLGTSNSSHGNM